MCETSEGFFLQTLPSIHPSADDFLDYQLLASLFEY